MEAYLDCFVTKDLSKLSFAEGVTFEGPRMPKLEGRATVLGFLAHILPMIKGIHLKQHIVEGEYIATIFDMETANGIDHAFDRFHILDGQIQSIHVLLLGLADRARHVARYSPATTSPKTAFAATTLYSRFR